MRSFDLLGPATMSADRGEVQLFTTFDWLDELAASERNACVRACVLFPPFLHPRLMKHLVDTGANA